MVPHKLIVFKMFFHKLYYTVLSFVSKLQYYRRGLCLKLGTWESSLLEIELWDIF